MKIDFKKMRPKNFNSYLYKSVKKLAQNVENGSGNKNLNKCPVCKSVKKRKYVVKYNIPIVTCEKCDLTYATRQPRNFDDVYSQDDYLEKSILSYDKNRKYRIKRFGLERIKILKNYKKKGKLLDFGCGTGWFLEGAKDHFESFGVEYSDSIRKWLLEKFNIKTFKTLNSIKSEKFDIITAFDVIEHVPDPLDLLNNLKKKLKKNGIILIYTPNFDSLGFNYLGLNNNLLCPPNHLFYFNKKSFDFMCKKINLKIVETQYRGLDVGDIYAMINENGDKKIANFLNQNSTLFQKFLDNIGYSNHIRFILKKK
jgi:2-polyprenyl-3-methyl-5-hydroxy-6-metoxy-1,4-benzoquinol methylase